MNNLMTMIIISAMLLTGCADKTNPPDNNKDETPSLKIEDYYPFPENTKYVYEGEGNEFASMTTYVDYIKDNRIQTRTDNGGTETVKVLEIKDGHLIELLNRGETYFRENFIEKEYTSGRTLLKEPLKTGTSWTNDSGATSTITNMSKEIVTKMGNFEAIEVTTEGKQGKTIDYYAKDTGLVKTVNIGEGYEVSSTISEIIKNQPFIQSITLYYPDADGITIHAVNVQISFNTNEEPKDIIEKNVKDLSVYEVLGPNTKINDLYFYEQEKSVHIDLSKEFITEMSAGSGFEAMILQCLTNTLGNYYQVEDVYITIDGGPYESGHIIIEKGEAYKVDYTNVKRAE